MNTKEYDPALGIFTSTAPSEKNHNESKGNSSVGWTKVSLPTGGVAVSMSIRDDCELWLILEFPPGTTSDRIDAEIRSIIDSIPELGSRK